MEKMIGYMFFEDGFSWKNINDAFQNKIHGHDIIKVFPSPFKAYDDYSHFLNDNGNLNHIVKVSYFLKDILHLETFPSDGICVERQNLKIEKELCLNEIIDYETRDVAGSLIVKFRNPKFFSDFEKVISSRCNFSYSFLYDNSSIVTKGDNAKLIFTGKNNKVLTSGNDTRIISNNTNNNIVSLGNNAEIFSFGDSATIFSSGKNSNIHIYGNNTLVNCAGEDSRIVINGRSCVFRAVKETSIYYTWIDKDKNIKDYIKINENFGYKENTRYCYCNSVFNELEILCS